MESSELDALETVGRRHKNRAPGLGSSVGQVGTPARVCDTGSDW